MQANLRDVDAINDDTTLGRVNLRSSAVSWQPGDVRRALTKRRILMARVLFPLPVRPSRPIRSFALSLKEIPCSTSGRSGAYLMCRSSTKISSSLLGPVEEGQYAGGRLSSTTREGSCGRSRYSTTRSTELHYLSTRVHYEDTSVTYLRSSSSAVQNRQAQ